MNTIEGATSAPSVHPGDELQYDELFLLCPDRVMGRLVAFLGESGDPAT
jgi:hypothetical protein